MIDPERFIDDDEALHAADTDTLEAAHAEAVRVYNFCGGHKLAARMAEARDTIHAELDRRAATRKDPA